MAKNFTEEYRGKAPKDGNMEAPASAMAAGLGVVRSGSTIAKAGAGIVPYGFLWHDVTDDGPTYEEIKYIATSLVRERKVSDGKVTVILYDPGVVYISSASVIKSSTTFAVGDYVYQAANGELTNDAAASVGDTILGIVEEISLTHQGETTAFAWQAIANLGNKEA